MIGENVNIDYLSLRWDDSRLFLLDQKLLPLEEVYFEAKSYQDCFLAIEEMIVRGAPLIGYTGAFGLTLYLRECLEKDIFSRDKLEEVANYLISSRPTAVNLKYEVDLLKRLIFEKFDEGVSLSDVYEFSLDHIKMQMSDLGEQNLKMARQLKDYLSKRYGDRPLRLLTLCNTGSLACGPIGTALGAITKMNEDKLVEFVWACETRPYLQGSRLTSYELLKENIEHEIIVEGAAAYLMQEKKIDAVIVGADRIVRNGDTANKIGTQSLSILANYFDIPFIVVAPTSSFDLSLDSGTQIEVEFRDPDEIHSIKGVRISPLESKAWNPSFDIASGKLISAISCEKGLITPVNENNVTETVGDKE